jgi:hypothetical protein
VPEGAQHSKWCGSWEFRGKNIAGDDEHVDTKGFMRTCDRSDCPNSALRLVERQAQSIADRFQAWKEKLDSRGDQRLVSFGIRLVWIRNRVPQTRRELKRARDEASDLMRRVGHSGGSTLFHPGGTCHCGGSDAHFVIIVPWKMQHKDVSGHHWLEGDGLGRIPQKLEGGEVDSDLPLFLLADMARDLVEYARVPVTASKRSRPLVVSWWGSMAPHAGMIGRSDVKAVVSRRRAPREEGWFRLAKPIDYTPPPKRAFVEFRAKWSDGWVRIDEPWYAKMNRGTEIERAMRRERAGELGARY